MAPEKPADGPPGGQPAEAADAELSRRLGSLEARLRDVDTRKAGGRHDPEAAPKMSGIGQAMRLSTEFIAGIIVGGGAGWALDRWLGTRPWGMIVLLMLGMAAGFFNVVRAAGLMKPRTGDKSGAK